MLPIVVVLSASLMSVTPAEQFLPPTNAWSGESEMLQVADSHRWVTPSELTGLTATPSYEETFSWLDQLLAASPRFHKLAIGQSAQGRTIWMIIASGDGSNTPEAMLANERPRVLVQAGIHSGEIDGKDAGLMLLRDLIEGGRLDGLLDEVNLLFVPILNVDGHERRSPYNRVNQRGPSNMGWRTNANNLNLNRDYAKLDTAGVRAIAEVVNVWQPQLYLDLHVTDGADYQYDITYGFNGDHAWSPASSAWLAEVLTPRVDQALVQRGHEPGPLLFAANDRDFSGGQYRWTAGVRFSNGWGDARHLPTVLVENHSLKPYRQRVLGTYVLLEAALKAAASSPEALREAIAADQQPKARIALGWTVGDSVGQESFELKAIRAETYLSEVTGGVEVRWTGEKQPEQVSIIANDTASAVTNRPAYYYIPPQWANVIEVLNAQGIVCQAIDSSEPMTVTRYRLPQAKVDQATTPFEGRLRIAPGGAVSETMSLSLPAGTCRVDTSQPLGTLAVLLLEPESPDSLLQWGFMASMLTRTEYIEGYVIEPMAVAMLEADPALRAEFLRKLESDADFASSRRERLRFFYERTPYYDEHYLLYPIYKSSQ